MKVKFICELTDELQSELRDEAIEVMKEHTLYSMDEIMDIVDNYVMNEKLINVVGYEDGLLNPEKWMKYII